MYLRKVEIKNIRSIEHFTLTFEPGKEAGWHVLIGDNGTGKTTILKSIAAALIGPRDILRVDPVWSTWLTNKKEKGTIRVEIVKGKNDSVSTEDLTPFNSLNSQKEIKTGFRLIREPSGEISIEDLEGIESDQVGKPEDPYNNVWSGRNKGWFSCGFGALRRFIGGNDMVGSAAKSSRIINHLTLLKPEEALVQTVEWLKYVHSKANADKDPQYKKIEEGVKHYLNQDGFLPEGYTLEKLTADGAFLKSPQGYLVPLNEVSEGIRSVLSLALEIIRLLLKQLPASGVFGHLYDEDLAKDYIHGDGVVLIDEIDAHLHPTWQVRIGQWFTKYFPNLQFIVTTHSPLICRAAEKGSVWRLAAPGSDETSRQITGTELDRLIYGNVLDAYGTEVFGENITSSDRATEMRQRLAQLSKKSMKGTISPEESQELQQIKSILPTGG